MKCNVIASCSEVPESYFDVVGVVDAGGAAAVVAEVPEFEAGSFPWSRSWAVVICEAASSGGGGIFIQLYWRCSIGMP